MEDGFICSTEYNMLKIKNVLILLLMEDGFISEVQRNSITRDNVLILLLMEDGFIFKFLKMVNPMVKKS